jgi:glycosidase
MRKVLVAILIVSTVLLNTYSVAYGSKLSYKVVKHNLLVGEQLGYLDTLYASFWIVKQGDSVIPHVGRLLNECYKDSLQYSSAFPFNAFWALAQFNSDKARNILAKYKNDKQAMFALKASKLRNENPNSKLGVLASNEELYQLPSSSSKNIGKLTAGSVVEILQKDIKNENEEGPRGGPAVFDKVRPSSAEGEVGYIQRGGDGGFPPFY